MLAKKRSNKILYQKNNCGIATLLRGVAFNEVYLWPKLMLFSN